MSFIYLTILVIVFVLIFYFVLGKSTKSEDEVINIPGEKLDINGFEKNGYGRIEGKIEPLNEYLKDPLLNKECVYYNIKTESLSGDTPTQLMNDNQFVDFLVKQDNVYAIVKMKGAITFLNQMQFKSEGAQVQNNTLEAYLLDKNLHRTQAFEVTLSTLEYLCVGEHIKIEGVGEWISSTLCGYDIPSDRVLLLETDGKIPTEISST